MARFFMARPEGPSISNNGAASLPPLWGAP